MQETAALQEMEERRRREEDMRRQQELMEAADYERLYQVCSGHIGPLRKCASFTLSISVYSNHMLLLRKKKTIEFVLFYVDLQKQLYIWH